MSSPSQTDLLGLTAQQLTEVVQKHGQPAYRGKQLFEALYAQRLGQLAQVSTLPQAFRQQLEAEGYRVGQPEIEKKFTSADGTVRYLMRFSDGQSVETVWMPEGDFGEAGDGTEAGEEEQQALDSGARRFDRATICVSSQVGCAVNCQFCLTALLGVKRNLSAGEIVGQVIAVLNDHHVDMQRERVNIVFMGMGEPFLNYENFIAAVQLLVEGVGFAESRMTVSTSGIVPRIPDLGCEAVRPKLAISLNAPNDEIRERVMPINRKWNLDALLLAAREFPLRKRERLTFEYVLLNGVNDAPEHAREVARRLQGMRCKVNLIALNPGPGIDFTMPEEQRVQDFQRILIEAGIPAFIRRPRGRDIYAACGQLKRTTGAA